jgi:hypothetical protein
MMRGVRSRAGRWSLLLAAGAASLAAASSASAAPYAITQCARGAAGGELTTGFVAPANLIITGACTDGQGLVTFSIGGTLSPTSASTNSQIGFVVSVPDSMPNTIITGIATRLSFSSKHGNDGLSYGDIATYVDNGLQWGDNYAFPAGTTAMPSAYPWVRSGRGSRSVYTRLQCYYDCEFDAPERAMTFDRLQVTLDDPAAPSVPAAAAVGLLGGGPQSGTGHLTVSGSDADSGVSSFEVRMQSGTLLAASPASGCVFTRPTPCPQSRINADLAVDTTTLPEGPQQLVLRSIDAAGNVSQTLLPSITVDNVPDPPAPAPVVAKAKVTFSMSTKSLHRGRTVKFSGKVSPFPAQGGRVVLEAKKGKRWITAAIVKIRKGGTYRWSHKFTHRGTLRLRARLLVGDATVRPGFSTTRKLVVR